ncbi:glycosyltransferase family 2 protein [Brumimicrobium aurantiacum]|uniref:Glycosyltransferase family 2 protein n=1 Tax=Brumimicrobium aurantiacum TaxID=1737063 RepID=A0A3E1EXQ6_9FLAO|nr:glycosyltransferase family 2 protein [Brumimicrobium aurantiacum]RFC54243.1 glycosyltransferase family 2 protein [Brumimicrobium aurantiacum]
MEHKITSTIITFNEERNIERCIDALVPISDEIIVLDSFSTDETVAICKRKNVRIEQREWKGYSSAKNYLNQLASYEYIFSVDADEAPDTEMQNEILKIKALGLTGIYEVNRMTNYCGKWIKHSGWYPDVKTRIFPKSTSQWEGAYVHEELVVKGNPKPERIKGHLLHYSYYSQEDHRQRADKYSELTAIKMYKRGKRVGPLKPYISALGRFVAMFIIKAGFLDGIAGFTIARISALSNIYKYKELRRLQHESNN